jgi:hypothetical protein
MHIFITDIPNGNLNIFSIKVNTGVRKLNTARKFSSRIVLFKEESDE